MEEGFIALLHAIRDSNNSNEEEIAALNARIRDALSVNPTIAKELDDCQRSLLHAALEAKLDESIIKVLIEANPSALLYTSLADPAPLLRPWPYGKNIINEIATHDSLFELMPWIANSFPTILDDEACLEQPPIFDLIQCGNGLVIKEFLEAHPQSHLLVDEEGCTPLHAALLHPPRRFQPDADTIKWMCEANPSCLLKTNHNGMTPLLCACYNISIEGFDDDASILKVLIEGCPQSIRRPDKYGYLPISYVLDIWDEFPQVIVAMLIEYPESLDISLSVYSYTKEYTKALIQRIKPHVDELRELKDNIFHLQVNKMFLDKAVACTKDKMLRSLSEVFDSWATDYLNALEPKVEEVSAQLLKLRRRNLDF